MAEVVVAAEAKEFLPDGAHSAAGEAVRACAREVELGADGGPSPVSGAEPDGALPASGLV